LGDNEGSPGAKTSYGERYGYRNNLCRRGREPVDQSGVFLGFLPRFHDGLYSAARIRRS
jgi:hypothetical protein